MCPLPMHFWWKDSWLKEITPEQWEAYRKLQAEKERSAKKRAKKIEAELKLEFGDDFDEWYDNYPRYSDKSLKELSLRLAYGGNKIARYRKPFAKLAEVEKEVQIK